MIHLARNHSSHPPGKAFPGKLRRATLHPRCCNAKRGRKQFLYGCIGLTIFRLGSDLGEQPAVDDLQRLHPRARRYANGQPALLVHQCADRIRSRKFSPGFRHTTQGDAGR